MIEESIDNGGISTSRMKGDHCMESCMKTRNKGMQVQTKSKNMIFNI